MVRRARLPRTIMSKTDVFKRTFQGSLAGTGAAAFSQLSFNINQLPNPTDLTNLFSEYRISFAKVKVTLRNQIEPTNAIPRIFIVRDYVNSTVPVNLDELREYSDLKTRKLSYTRPQVFTIRPATSVLQGDGVTKVPVWRQWIPSTSPSCNYLGFRIGFDPIPVGQTIDFEFMLYVHCRKPK